MFLFFAGVQLTVSTENQSIPLIKKLVSVAFAYFVQGPEMTFLVIIMVMMFRVQTCPCIHAATACSWHLLLSLLLPLSLP